MADKLFVQVCYADDKQQVLIDLQVAAGTTLEQAIVASGLLQKVSAIDLSVNKTGIFSKIKPLDTVLRDKDRVEIYRPLVADPKESRRRRAKSAGKP